MSKVDRAIFYSFMRLVMSGLSLIVYHLSQSSYQEYVHDCDMFEGKIREWRDEE